MAKSSTFRFAIADSEPRSELWSVFTNRNDVYLTGSAFKRALKVSLHASGVCQIALLEGFFTEQVEWRPDKPESRSILRWKRLPTAEDGGQVAASILFASHEFWREQLPIPASKPFTSLTPPPDMHGRIVNAIFCRENPIHAAEMGGWTDDLLFSTQLPNAEFFCLKQQLEPLPKGFFDFAPLDAQYALSLDNLDGDLGDERGISCLDCFQLFEGCGCIRSLHNMRIMKVPKADEEQSICL